MKKNRTNKISCDFFAGRFGRSIPLGLLLKVVKVFTDFNDLVPLRYLYTGSTSV